jgi:hypothetical protein
MAINAIKTTTATTRKIPKPIPALKMPAMASQELNVVNRKSKVKAVRNCSFFIIKSFMVY